MNFRKVNVPNMPGGGAVSALIKFGVVAGIGIYGVANSLYNVEGGHRAIVFNRITGVKDKVYPEGTHIMIPWFERPTIYDVRARPHLVESTSGSRDLQMDGGVWGLHFYGASNQVNVSSGNVTASVNNYVRKDFPLAVYQLDRVLLPKEFYEAKPPAPAPPPARGNRSGSAGSGGGAVAPSTGNPAGNGAGRMDRVGLGLVAGFWVVLCMGIFA